METIKTARQRMSAEALIDWDSEDFTPPIVAALEEEIADLRAALAQRAASQDTVPTTVANQAINDALRVGMQDSERDAASRVTVEMLQAQIDIALQIITTTEEQNKIETQLNQNGERDAALREAVGKMIKAKGRFHTEQNYAALVSAYDAAMAAQQIEKGGA